jgi:diguanylate cyclase (GGDEF) domain protein
MIEKVKKFLLYNYLEAEDFNRIKSRVNQTNRRMLTLVSTGSTIIVGILMVLSFFIEAIAKNQIIYQGGFLISFILLLGSLFYTKKHEKAVPILVNINFLFFYIYGITIGIYLNRNEYTVTFIIMLILLPICFINRPIHTFGMLSVYILTFVLLCLKYKTGNVRSIDILNSILYGLFGAIVSSVMHCLHCRGYVFEQKLQEVGHIDQLTQINNRNAYEFTVNSIPSLCKINISCLYIDVNGLHELNNEKGHEAGDEMLRFIASRIKRHFGRELSFRTGGDEFVVFIPDRKESVVNYLLVNMTEEIEKEGYHIAVGLESIPKSQFSSMRELLKAAEMKMYSDKAEFYKKSANNRRCRC